jgi:Eco57I restriction-modification methylase/N-6 DNA Methylase
MALDLSSAKLIGPALPEPFVKFDLEQILNQNKLLPKTTGHEGSSLQEFWDTYRRKLRNLGSSSGAIRVKHHVIDPLIESLGYKEMEEGGKVSTREGIEAGGFLLNGRNDAIPLRVWTVSSGTDLEAPVRRGYAYRFSPVRIAQRVLLTTQERLGILTDGLELRLLISDSARPDSQVIIPIDPEWKRSREVPDTFRFLLAIASPKGVEVLPGLIDKARLKQTAVTKELRKQARQAIEEFIQEILDDPKNKDTLEGYQDKEKLAKDLWHEGLIFIYRLLFVLKGEASDDPARSFSFTGSSVWRNTYSPTVRLAGLVRSAIDQDTLTGNFLESGLRTIFKMFSQGVRSVELNIAPMGGALFGEDTTPLLSKLHWPERGCANLLDKLLWTIPHRRGGGQARERIHYGSLDIEDLGRVYEALLELEPGISIEGMCRLRRSKLEVVVPYEQGEKYRADLPSGETDELEEESENDEEEEEVNKKKTKVQWIEGIRPRQFYLRVGLGRKSSGSYYTPHSFVRFLVQETLGPKIDECSPKENPNPNEILKLKVLDPAMGSGHFLVEACRFMADKLYEACRLCDEKALELENKSEKEINEEDKKDYLLQAYEWRKRIVDIPDPDDEILKYLPSAAPEHGISGLSQSKAIALCKRLVTVHCLYGVDKNPLAVELAKLSLWLESQSEGLPLTFLDHRLVFGDSITGPFFQHLLKYPGSQEPLDDMFNQNLRGKLVESLQSALLEVNELDKSIGIDISDLTSKQRAKERLENSLLPFKALAAAWSGGVMLGEQGSDDDYLKLAQAIVEGDDVNRVLSEHPRLQKMVESGRRGIVYDLAFPEVFYSEGKLEEWRGFDAVVGNPPWDMIQAKTKEFLAGYELEILQTKTKAEEKRIEAQIMRNLDRRKAFEDFLFSVECLKLVNDQLYKYQKLIIEGDLAGRQLDAFRIFLERNTQVLNNRGFTGVVVPSAFHGNAGAAGVRQLYLEKMAMKCCFSYENRNKLFEIHSSFKFAVVVAQKNLNGTDSFKAAFYLHDVEWLFPPRHFLDMNKILIERFSGAYLNFPEPKDEMTFDILRSVVLGASEPFGHLSSRLGIVWRNNPESLHMTLDKHRFVKFSSIGVDEIENRIYCQRSPLKDGWLPLYEGKTIHQFLDRWDTLPGWCIPLKSLNDKPVSWHESLRYYRVAMRMVASSTNERTGIFTVLPPGIAVGHSVGLDQQPSSHHLSSSLLTCALGNSFVFDFLLRQAVAANVTLFLLRQVAIPLRIESHAFMATFLIHSALRLCCNHAGYGPLWHDQLGDAWREPIGSPLTWPVLSTEEERWEVRSAIDAVITDAYGLNRDQYEHVLRSFDRASGPNPYTDICLRKYDELKKMGVERFTKKYDPYWDIPFNEELPKPVIDLPIPEEIESDLFIGRARSTTRKRGRKK